MENNEPTYRTKSVAEAIEDSSGIDYIPVTFESCEHIVGPFFHGTKTAFEIGDLIGPGHPMNHDQDRISNHLYFAALVEPAIWGAELAVARRRTDRERVYVVEPLGAFEDDPNVTNKKFPGNVTQSYRTRHPMRVVDEVARWEPHPPDVLQSMVKSIARLRDKGLDVVYD